MDINALNPNLPGLDPVLPGGQIVTVRSSRFAFDLVAGTTIAPLVDPFGSGSTYETVGTVPGQLALSGDKIVRGSSTAIIGATYTINIVVTAPDGVKQPPVRLTFRAALPFGGLAPFIPSPTPSPVPSPSPSPSPTPSPTMTFANSSLSVVEGNSGTKTVTNPLNIDRKGVTGALTVTLIYTGTATNGVDFTGPASVSVPAGSSSVDVSIVVNGDTAVESDETVVISAALSGYPATAGSIVTITNDDVTAQPSPVVAWTPAMIGTAELYDPSVPASFQNAAGTQLQEGEGLLSAASQTSNGRSASQPTASLQPTLGGAADASPTGVRPLLFRGGQSLPTSALPAQLPRYTIFALLRFKAGATGSRYVIGTPGGIYNLLQSSSATPGGVRSFITSQDLETSTEERIRSFTQNVQDTGLTFTALQGREETFNTTASGKSLLTGERFYIGSTSGGAANGIFDLFGFGLVPSNLSRANEQRMLGYMAHRAGLASSVLEPSNPYFSSPPMVPAGTTTTLDWLELPAVVGPKQTFLGGLTELQADSYYRGSTPPTDDSHQWGFPFSLTMSERARFKAALMGSVAPIIMFIRFPLGFGYRGFRNIDPTTGLAKNIGERFAGQNAAVLDMLSNVIPLGGGLIPGVWSPPPYWKTTSSYAFGRLWAGGSYARDVSLESIRTSDPTQFAAQIEALASAQLDDLEYLHKNMGPVRGYEGPNEPISDVDNFYGTCMMSAGEYAALIRAIVPKIRNSAVLSVYGGQPNFVMLFGESFKGFDNAGTTFTNTALLSTGKTLLAEMTGQTFHEIPEIFRNPDYIRTNQWSWLASGRGKPSFVNEMWFRPGEYTDAERFSRVCAWQLHQINLVRAPIVLPIIHAMKDIPVNGAAHDAIGYPLAHMRLPAPFGQDPSTPGDFNPAIPYGGFDFVKPNWHGARFVLENIRPGAVIRKVDLPQGVSGIAAAATIVDGKRRILVVNWSAAPLTLTTTLGTTATYSVIAYTATDAAVPAGNVSGPTLSMTFAPYTAYVLTEA